MKVLYILPDDMRCEMICWKCRYYHKQGDYCLVSEIVKDVYPEAYKDGIKALIS